MTLTAARLVAGGLGLFMIYFVLGGMLGYPVFYWPDLIMGIVLTIAALLPRRLALTALPMAGAYALGVYGVAAANHFDRTGTVTAILMVSIALAATVTILALAARRSVPA